jgi:hypothetical protein
MFPKYSLVHLRATIYFLDGQRNKFELATDYEASLHSPVISEPSFSFCPVTILDMSGWRIALWGDEAELYFRGKIFELSCDTGYIQWVRPPRYLELSFRSTQK